MNGYLFMSCAYTHTHKTLTYNLFLLFKLFFQEDVAYFFTKKVFKKREKMKRNSDCSPVQLLCQIFPWAKGFALIVK